MRRLALLLVPSLCLLGALPLLADEKPTLEGEVQAFLRTGDPVERLARGLALVGRKPEVAELGVAVEKGWRWEAAAAKGQMASWTVTTDDGIDHSIFAYAPPSYTPERAWPLLLWMHGGVAREEDGGGRGAIENFKEDAEEKGFLVLAPSTQKDAMWWTPRGVSLIREALAGMKRRYRVDPNRVAAAGFSDGGSACFHLLLHDPDPYCCFLSFAGTPISTRLMGGPSWAGNVGTRPIYAVNGGKDQLFPSGALTPFIEELKRHGADLTWIDEPELGHDYALLEKRWEEAFAFWQQHPRGPLPNRIAWTTSRPDGAGRHGWVEIEEIFSAARKAKDLEAPAELRVPDLRRPRLGIRIRRDFEGPGLYVENVEEGTPADGVFEDGDVILKAGETELLTPEDLPLLPEYLSGLAKEDDGLFVVKRLEKEVELCARPKILAKDKPPRPEELGYDVVPARIVAEVKDGNVIDVRTHGVLMFRLHLSPDLVDFGKPLKVLINGESVPLYEGPVPASAAYVLAEAVRQGPGAPLTLGFLDGEVSVPRATGPEIYAERDETEPHEPGRVVSLTASDGAAGDKFGIGVSLSGDIAVVGAPAHDGGGATAGAAYVFERDRSGRTGWRETKKLLAGDAVPGNRFGHSVAVSGHTLVIGSPDDDARGSNSGSALVFERNHGGDGNWGEVRKLIASDGRNSDLFGYRLDLDGDTAIVGAWRARGNLGAVYVFGRNHGGANNWGEVKKLVAADPQPNDQFGRFLAIDGDTVVVGAFQYGKYGPGKAYVFQRDRGGPDNWGQVKKLVAIDAGSDDNFGHGVGVSGDVIVVGNRKHDSAGENAGAAYVFERDEGGPDNWGLVKKLTAEDAVPGVRFGCPVGVEGDRVVVGAPDTKPRGNTFYVYERNEGGPGNWGETRRLNPSDAGRGEEWVAVDAGTIIVSVPYDDDRGENAGSAHVFR